MAAPAFIQQTTCMDHCTIRPLTSHDVSSVLEIMNYYAVNTTYDFSDKPYTPEHIHSLIHQGGSLPRYAAETDGEVIGFGIAYPFRPEKTFIKTVKFTYWIKPPFTRNGIGSRIYHLLEKDCREKGIENILVNISSENEGSIRFHDALGFVYCGRLWEIALKDGRTFDLVWLQKSLKENGKIQGG
jgi:phosphinothricin acetyltransferase